MSLRSRLAPRAGADVTWRHWVVLAVSMGAAAATSTVVMGAPYLLPALHDDEGMSLGRAGVVVAMPQVGIVLALLPWGWVVDRAGERVVLVAGLLLTTLACGAAALTHGPITLGGCLFAAGLAAASTNSASGRVVVGWFPARRRGLAMGIRQMSTPLGAALAAMTLPTLAHAVGPGAALVVPALVCAAAAGLVVLAVTDPPRPERRTAGGLAASPYRVPYLWRIHGVSLLLVVPQALMNAYLLVWLMTDRGWSPVSAGAAVTAGQLLGAAGRIAAGAWSDRLGSRMVPLRVVAGVAALVAGLLAATEATPGPGRVAGLAVALALTLTVVSVADNGLAFTAVAEYAGPFWSGRALSVQNTSQFVAMAAATPLFGRLVERSGYAVTFAVAAVVAAVAVPLVPRGDRRGRDARAEAVTCDSGRP